MFLSHKEKKSALMLFVAIRISLCFAVSKSVLYDGLMKDGDAKSIIKEFKKNPDMSRMRIGKDKDSLVMRAIKYDRPEEIIRLLFSFTKERRVF